MKTMIKTDKHIWLKGFLGKEIAEKIIELAETEPLIDDVLLSFESQADFTRKLAVVLIRVVRTKDTIIKRIEEFSG